MKEITYAQAINEAISEEMRRDENVFVMGEDIGLYCGAFGVSEDDPEFGEDRIMDTPIAEQAYVGAGVGAAMCGMRPIVELMFSDFMCVCFDELVNEAAKLRFMFGGKVKVPLVMRAASGLRHRRGGPALPSLEACLAHFPGLKVVILHPLRRKGADENRYPGRQPGDVPGAENPVPRQGHGSRGGLFHPLGQADIKLAGSDCTVVTYGRMVTTCLTAAQELEKTVFIWRSSISALVPLDTQTILESVKKTKHVLIVHEAVQFCGFGAEIAGQIADSDAFYYLTPPLNGLAPRARPSPSTPFWRRKPSHRA